eukprot:XP_016663216.1 PREDICTED: protein TRC8 homolog [Acyrthosiphon pisum]
MAIMSVYNLSRIPILILIDTFLKSSFGFPELADIIFPENNDFVNSTLRQIEIGESAQYYKAIFLSLFKIIVSCLIFCSSSCLFVLPARYLYMVYFHLVSVCIVLLSFSANRETLKVVYGKYENIETNLFDKDLPWDYFLLLVFNFLHDFTKNQPIHRAFSFNFTIPTLTVTFLHGTWIDRFLYTVMVLSTLLPLYIMLKTLWLDLFTITNLINYQYSRIRVTINGFRINNLLHLVLNVVEVLEVEWNRLNISSVLRMFWALRVLEQILYLITDMEIQNETLFGVVKNVLIKGCDTFTAVLGMTSFVSYFCHYIGAFFQWMLLIKNVDDKNIGIISAVFFYILALQTGLPCLEEHFISFYHDFYLLSASYLYYIHYVVNPSLMSLSVSYNPSLKRHIEALLVGGNSIVVSITILNYLWSLYSVSIWLLAVSFFNIQITIQLLESLAVYSLFLIDAHRTTFWEKLDDYVYYIKLFCNTVEFYLGIFLFLNGVYIMAFVSGGAVLTSMMYIHAYFNIWCDARNAWKVYIRRRTAVKKIESLPEATSVQLSELDDVCAICSRNIESAKITKCNHYFHGVCLRKWLYVKDRCPSCHDILYKAETSNVQT